MAAILDSADQALTQAKQDPTALSSDKQDPFAEADKLATGYGLTERGS